MKKEKIILRLKPIFGKTLSLKTYFLKPGDYIGFNLLLLLV